MYIYILYIIYIYIYIYIDTYHTFSQSKQDRGERGGWKKILKKVGDKQY